MSEKKDLSASIKQKLLDFPIPTSNFQLLPACLN